MHSPGEEIDHWPPGVNDQAGRHRVVAPDLAAALAAADYRFLSCRCWLVDATWSIPPRRVADTFLFLPLRGAVDVVSPAGRERLSAGQIALIPHGVRHAMTHVPRQRELAVIAIHAHVLTAWGTPWLGPPTRLIAPLTAAEQWATELARLAGLAHDHPALGQQMGRQLVARLLTELVLAGHPVTPPATQLDPRLARLVAALQAEPGRAANITALARSLDLQPLRVRQLFHAGLGCAPKTFIDRLRLRQAGELLRGGTTVAATAEQCGFASVRQFQARFKAAYGVTPTQWAAGTTLGV
jgi:AraC-like DNA-binding protein/mannose-6-phosphate isomerase-like protein (cupin superfamily)